MVPAGPVLTFAGENAVKYAILVYETAGDFNCRNDEANKGPYWGAWTAYATAMKDAGVNVGGNALQPPHTGTTVRIRAAKKQVQDGPYADAKEQLGGFVIIDVPNLDAALEWASRCPAASTGAVEVRPILSL